jgi:tricorn protease
MMTEKVRNRLLSRRRKSINILSFLVLLTAGFTGSLPADEPRPLMRFPDIHGDKIVFVYGGDIWTASVTGGIASRLTIHDGEEYFPRYSPDGSLIAFSGEYDGNADVYVMNSSGGEIRRVTFHPGYDEVIGWHPVNGKILFRSNRSSYAGFSRLFQINPDGSDPEELPLPEASFGCFSPDGRQIAYTKVAREQSTWKRYQGGTAQDIYLYDFDTKQEKNISGFKGTDRLPMWIGDHVYFSSDRDRVLNIYGYDVKNGTIEQITRHSEYDVRRPSMGGEYIIYELGGSLWLLNTATKSSSRIEVGIRTATPETRPHWQDVTDYIQGFDCSPSAKRVVLVARGEIFSIPQEHGMIRNLSKDSGSREKDATWSPDGKWIAYFSDRSGEYQLYLGNPGGEKEAVQLTRFLDGYRHTLRWSPDSKKIAFADQTLSCFYLDIASKKITRIDKAEYEDVDVSIDRKPISDFNWSPDSRFIAYSKMNADLVYNLYIYSLESGQSNCVSQGIFNDLNPVFTADGEHLLFMSNRLFDPAFCDFEWEMVYKKVAGIYALTLRKNGQPLLHFLNDEEGAGDQPNKAETEAGTAKAVKVSIDFDGLAERIETVPLTRGNYRSLAVNGTNLYYLNADEGDFNRFEFRELPPMTLYAFSFKKREEQEVVKDIDGYKLSADGSTIIYRQGKKIGLLAADARTGETQYPDLSGLNMWLDPVAEWKQIYHETWRLERDYYYESNMHGLDWPAMREKYGKLLPFISCRQDLSFLIGELIGELNTSHTYVSGGHISRSARKVNVGMLGADYDVDKQAKRYKFRKIYRVADWTQKIIPPLSVPGLQVKEGDYLLQVDGQDVYSDKEVYAYFQNLAGKQVTLLVNDSPSLAGARRITVEPIAGEYTLRYLDWVERNRLLADKLSQGDIGYIHLPDTYTASAREFPKYFYSQTRKKGLIVDGRFNGGGLDPDIFLQRLDKEVLSYWTRRNSHDQTTPAVVTRAHMVCITNRQAGSGGDMLPYEFKLRGMGPVIGTRTWGGLVGCSMYAPLIDGGTITAPDYRIYNTAGKWVVENEGVEPDIVVDLSPAEMEKGIDAQLLKAVEILLQKIKEDPRPWPKHEPFPLDK